jgi:hypothetical protein
MIATQARLQSSSSMDSRGRSPEIAIDLVYNSLRHRPNGIVLSDLGPSNDYLKQSFVEYTPNELPAPATIGP